MPHRYASASAAPFRSFFRLNLLAGWSVVALAALLLGVLSLAAPDAAVAQQAPGSDAPSAVDPLTGEPLPGVLPGVLPDAQAPAPQSVSDLFSTADAPLQPDAITLQSYLRDGATRVARLAGDVLYVNNGTQFQSYDVADPASPQLLSSVPVPALASDLVLQDSLALLAVSQTAVVRAGTGLRVIDISDPAAMQEIGSLGDRPGLAVAASGSYAYLGEGSAGLSIIDLSDPANPTEVSRFSTGGSANGVDVEGDVAYVATGGAGLRVVDVSDPLNPTDLASLPTSAFATYVETREALVYLTGGFGLSVIDAADPAQPAVLGTYATAETAFEVALAGDTAYVAASSAGVAVVDVADPSAPALLGTYEDGGSAFGIAAQGDRAYVAERFDGIRVLDTATLDDITALALIPGGGFSFYADLQGDVAYFADINGRLRLIDVSDPAAPAELSRLPVPSNAQRLDVDGDVAYVTDADFGASGLTLVDVSDPADPQTITTFATGSQAFGVEVVADTAYVANGFGGTIGVDVSDPENPVQLFSFSDFNVRDLAVSGSVAYTVKFGGGLTALDVSDASNVTQLGTFVSDVSNENFVSGIVVEGDVAYLATGGGLVLLDISDPAAITKISVVPTPSTGPRDVVYHDERVYLSEDFRGVRLYDVSDPAAPVELDFFPSADRALGLAEQSGLVALAAGGGGAYFFGEAAPDDEAVTVTPQPGPDSTRTVAPGTEFLVPIDVTSLDGLDVQSYQFTLTFASMLLEPVGIETEGTLSEDATVAVNTDVEGQISVAAADSEGDVPILTIEGEGTLIFVRLQATEELGTSELAFTSFLFNEGEPPAATETTSIEVGQTPGDVNGDGEVTAGDAALILDFVVGLAELDEEAIEAGDVSGNGTLTAFDASLVLDFVVGNIDCFPVEPDCEIGAPALAATSGASASGAAANGAQANAAQGASSAGELAWGAPRHSEAAATQGAGAPSASAEQTVQVPLVLSGMAGTSGMAGEARSVELQAELDLSKVSVEGVESRLPEGWQLAHHVSEDGSGQGTLTLAAAGATALPEGEVALLTLRWLRADGSVSDKRLELAGQASVNEAAAAQMAGAELSVLPEAFAVVGNAPNPFSRQTRILVDLPVASEITVEVFDVLGRRVLTLGGREMEAGSAQGISIDAARLASGTYLYRVTATPLTEGGEGASSAERQTETGRMVVVK